MKRTVSNMMKLTMMMCLALTAGGITVRAADAQETYKHHCAMCHGPDGKGNTRMGAKLGIKDYSDPKVQDALKDADVAKAIKEGVKEGDTTKMKAFTDLSDDDIKSLVAYFRTLKK